RPGAGPRLDCRELPLRRARPGHRRRCEYHQKRVERLRADEPEAARRLRHVALTVGPRGPADGRLELRLYVDGQILGGSTAETADEVLRGERPLLLNAYDTSHTRTSFSGTIDELRISRVVRYLPGFSPPPRPRFEPDADTVALYHCDEGAGDVLKD